jgi:hypothetical protein
MIKSGISFIEAMPKTNGAKPGMIEPENWQPYKLWAADLYECPDCKSRIISGVGQGPVSEHYKDDFAETVKLCNPIVTVNDC